MEFSLSELNYVLGDIKNLGDEKKDLLNFKNISIDSRTLLSSDLFIAIKGKNFDGHSFLSEVLNKGVQSVVIKKGMQKLLPSEFPCWVVDDTLEAFQKLTLLKRKKLNIPIVAITGSVGKTTTKEMIGEVLKKLGRIKVSRENCNNEIGVGLTILGTDIKDKVLVLEMGMRGLGQIENLSKYSEPDIAVITNIGTAHIGLLGSKKNITYAKCEISKFLNPKGVVIIPANDSLLEKTLKEDWRGRVIKVELLNIENQNENFKRDYNLRGFYNPSNKTILIEENTFEISFEGFHNASNFLFAYAAAKELGIDFKSFNKFDFVSLGGRNKVLKSVKTTIYDESYNASPESVKACIENLLEKPRNKFFIFGSMQELGKESEKYHKEIFNLINNSEIEKCLFICDKKNEKIYTNYLKDKKKFVVLNHIKDVPFEINKSTKKGDSILIKGSRFWQLEKIIELIN
ncbi:UDP-N-acetylmuramoylalanyl-D-glutamate--2,6-diaminopimelate ligase [Prochlorococcus marinus str. MU1404]|uniref:UDP-N-acetylmuramoyl-tripeptide--D-alanyl-D- alanine ligase n=1 Tax=Prochlorococcus marinus TaxID=1219 RepID=UPI001ADBDFDF|nr:UDP-N-acetylmuramoyl-tripeptide--D-alanyl-D-alanine ligase [Prochlorococcus marinus]MBO8229813.1 UDP-N-acetylmuramoyl-tripeptide--D-alanyl-D-alanine ligase [Prochlorococcus marinus XMU1404]MBW3072891.1 UDP-N-acetylmuramoylalanyl-D-glutamate--2,6-diaminopimelate ligase [Prochlorococcus marinus str. MU1404]MCR8545851.1 UDP-N-acetylmuramoyl-tripeptide--D-alanyl-D-alanine ligase [Prochlorococcus marinus CUG1432]